MKKYNYLKNTMSNLAQLQFNKFVQMDLNDGQILPKELIFNYYGSRGGTKEFKESDYANYLEYATAKRNYEKGQVFTPFNLCEFVIESLSLTNEDTVMDLTCGMGSFFNFVPNEKNCYGVEIDEDAFNVVRYLYPEANIELDDVRFNQPEIEFDYVVINPPFYLNFFDFEDSHSFVIHKAIDVVKPGGTVAIIVPTTYLETTEGNTSEIAHLKRHADFIGQFELGEDMFKGNRVTVPTKLMLFKRNDNGDNTEYNTDITQLNINDENALIKVKTLINAG